VYIEIHNYEDIEQGALYFKLTNALSLETDNGMNEKISGVYAIYNENTCLYVGQSKNIASRIATHLRGKYKKATSIYIWDVKEIGFSDFLDRGSESRKNILNNCEQFLMTILKPIDNLLINMDKEIKEDMQPNIDVNDSSNITFSIRPGVLTITDSYSFAIDNIATSIDYLDYTKKISKKTHKLIREAISLNEIQEFSEVGELL